jgi:hypothetical protein
LPQIFVSKNGAEKTMHEVLQAEEFSSSQYEAIASCLDEFCALVHGQRIKEQEHSHFYQQVIFAE